MSQEIDDWRVHILLEVGGGIVSNILEYSSPAEVATRLEAIAKELRQFYGDDDGAIEPSSRPEINQLPLPYQP